MYAIDKLVKEHELITRGLKVIRKLCYDILKENKVNFEDFYQVADFVKYYADDYHHGKEEKLLFKAMEEHLGALGQKLIRQGMLVEHDLGRYFMSQLREALKRVQEGDEESRLDIIANAIAYTDLLKRHIEKENEVVYTFGEKKLSKEVLEEINAQTQAFEQTEEARTTQKHYEEIIEKLEKKYCLVNEVR